jgi:hypothetical protein
VAVVAVKGEERIEERDGQVFRVTVLPEAKPPPQRSNRTRFKFKDVGKQGSRGDVKPIRPVKPS